MSGLRTCFHRLVPFALIGVLATGSLLEATTLRHFDLAQMVQRAALIFRGTVLDAEAGTLRVGGGELPVITYTLQVEEGFKGAFEEVDGRRIARIRMLGKFPPRRVGTARRFSPLPDLPTLTPGSDYLLFVTAPGPIGLSTTLGLGQGRFKLQRKPQGEIQAVNGFNNLGLFRPPRAPRLSIAGPSLPASGPVSYSVLADGIRAELAPEGGGSE